MKTFRWLVPEWTGLITSAFCLPLQAQQATTPRAQPLFDHVKTTLPANAPALRYARAYQPVRIRWQALNALQPGSRLLFNLMEGVNPIGVIERIERRAETRYSCFGHLEGIDGSFFILVREEDALALFVNVPSRQMTFDLRSVKDDLYVVVLVGDEPPCGNQGDMTPPPFEMTPEDAEWRDRFAGHDFEPAGGDFGTAACVQPQAVLDIAVYYTTQARQAIGGVDLMNARIQLFIDQCNQAYQNSQVSLTARLVRRLEVTYTNEGNGNSSTQLDHLTNPGDGVIDGIHPDRTNFRADQVILLVNNMDACGRAWCGNGGDPDRAFGVVQWGCTTYSFPHEIGHNQGCGHDRDNGGCDFRSYGFGWRFTGNDGVQYRTVMAYAPGTRIPHFSNPNVTYQGVATGVPIGLANEAHNAQVITETRRSRENFRLLDIWVDFGYGGVIELGTFIYPFNTMTEGVNAIPTFVDTAVLDYPTLYIKAGSRQGSITVTKRMRVRACGGRVRIGAP
ncbi:MAG: zinc-dependent metalloprotease [Fimbriimonadales bacterium]|nr:zinc-dependent metalloprotease [Fimbriimonadales bacterium]